MQKDGLVFLLNNLRAKCTETEYLIFEDLGLSQGEFNFFVASSQFDNLICADMQNEMGISSSRFSRIVDKMVKNGYLNRTSDTSDRRVINISFTENGKNIRDEVMEKLSICEQKIIKNLSTSQIQNLKQDIELIINNFDNEF